MTQGFFLQKGHLSFFNDICPLKIQLWVEVIKKPKKVRSSKVHSANPGLQLKRRLPEINLHKKAVN
jgi:hypothetical protein